MENFVLSTIFCTDRNRHDEAQHNTTPPSIVLPSYALATRDLDLPALGSRPQRVTHPSLSPIPNLSENFMKYRTPIENARGKVEHAVTQNVILNRKHQMIWTERPNTYLQLLLFVLLDLFLLRRCQFLKYQMHIYTTSGVQFTRQRQQRHIQHCPLTFNIFVHDSDSQQLILKSTCMFLILSLSSV